IVIPMKRNGIKLSRSKPRQLKIATSVLFQFHSNSLSKCACVCGTLIDFGQSARPSRPPPKWTPELVRSVPGQAGEFNCAEFKHRKRERELRTVFSLIDQPAR